MIKKADDSKVLNSMKESMRQISDRISTCKLARGVAKVGEYGSFAYSFIKLMSAGIAIPKEEMGDAFYELANARLAEVLPDVLLGGALMLGFAGVSYGLGKAINYLKDKYDDVKKDYDFYEGVLKDKYEKGAEKQAEENFSDLTSAASYDYIASSKINEFESGTSTSALNHENVDKTTEDKDISKDDNLGKEIVKMYREGADKPFSDGNVNNPDLFVNIINNRVEGSDLLPDDGAK